MFEEILLNEKSTNPREIQKKLMEQPDVPMHGPIHHYVDGAAFLTAMHNAGVKFDLADALKELEERSQLMPGATCGRWGVCGSASSVGAALAIIHGTGPLSSDDFYKDNLRLTSRILAREAELGGPRCCKRNGFTALDEAVDFVKEQYGIRLEESFDFCSFSLGNETCQGEDCPYNRNYKELPFN